MIVFLLDARKRQFVSSIQGLRVSWQNGMFREWILMFTMKFNTIKTMVTKQKPLQII